MATAKESRQRATVLAVLLANYANGKANPYHLAAIVGRLQAAARMAHRKAENACNAPMTEAQTVRDDAWHDKTQATINQILEAEFVNKHNLPTAPTVSLGGDPRGPCAYLKIPGVVADGWDRDAGFAIY